jgi:propanediol dehydratase small subunit
MTNFNLIVVSTFVGFVLWGVFVGGQLPRPYRGRPCQGKRWRIAFPDAPNDDIRTFLSDFTDAFAFPDKEKLKFSPDDTILQVYRALYSRKWMADALEVETLEENIESKYRIKFDAIWHENLSLGELFAVTRRERQQ